MELKDVATVVHFRELHFLPRVIFFIGAVCFIGSFFVKILILGLIGVGVMLSASTLNLVLNTILRFYGAIERRVFDIPWALSFQALLALAITIATLQLTYYFYRHGEMPSYLRPLPKQIDFRPLP
jgi:hypothetical protein